MDHGNKTEVTPQCSMNRISSKKKEREKKKEQVFGCEISSQQPLFANTSVRPWMLNKGTALVEFVL